MIARLGSSRPEKSRGRHFKSPSFVLFIFFLDFSFCIVGGGLLLLLQNSKGRCFDTDTHIHTTDRGLVVQGVLRSGVNMIYSELSRWRF